MEKLPDGYRLRVRIGSYLYEGARDIEERLPGIAGYIAELANRDREVLESSSRVYDIGGQKATIWYKGRNGHRMKRAEIRRMRENRNKWGW